MRYEIQLPGALGPNVLVETSLFGLREISVGGMPVQRGPGRGGHFLIPLAEGGYGELTYKFGWTHSHVLFQGQRFPLGRKLHPVEAGLVILPFGLGLLFGIPGWLAGAAAALVNGIVIRASLPVVLRFAAGLGAIAVAGVVAFYVSVGFSAGVFITPDWEKVGSCWQSTPTAGEAVGRVPTVDCAQPHAAEVYAVPVVRPEEIGGGFDEARLDVWAATECLDAFEPFVGIAYEQSRLEVRYVIPSLATWAVGDRLVVCAVVDPAGQQLVGSMRGSRQ